MLILFASISVINYNTLIQTTKAEEQQILTSSMDNYTKSLDLYFDEIEHVLAFYANSSIVQNVMEDPAAYEAMLVNSFRLTQITNDKITMLGYGTVKGQYFIDRTNVTTPEGYDPRTRPWYIRGAIMDQGQYGYTEPYVNLHTGDKVFTVATPVFDDDGQRMGVMAVILNMDELIHMTETNTVATKGYTFLTRGSRYFIAHDPNQNDTLIDIPEIAHVSERAQDTQIKVTIDGQKMILQSQYNPRTGLTIWAAGYESELMGEFYNSLRNSILVLVFLVLGLIGVIGMLSRYLASEISELSEAASRMAKGDFSVRMHLESSEEVRNVAETFNSMATTIEAQTMTLKTNLDTMAESYRETVSLLSNAIEARDLYSAGHCRRVAQYGMMMAEALGYSKERKQTLEFACMLHDVGKLGIPTEILNKDAELSPSEMEKFKEHVQIGYFILNDIKHLKGIADIVLEHHEWVNGEGYPRGIKGDALQEESKILAIAETYDNLTQIRPYRKTPYSKSKALAQLRQQEDTQFDARLVELFIRLMDRQGE